MFDKTQQEDTMDNHENVLQDCQPPRKMWIMKTE